MKYPNRQMVDAVYTEEKGILDMADGLICSKCWRMSFPCIPKVIHSPRLIASNTCRSRSAKKFSPR